MDLRIEELKSQNRQLLEELFSLKKSYESKEEELTELKEKVSTVTLSNLLAASQTCTYFYEKYSLYMFDNVQLEKMVMNVPKSESCICELKFFIC